MTIMSGQLKIKKMTLVELHEALERQNRLVNSNVLEKLKDKGAAIKKTRDQIQAEIDFRKSLDQVESSLSQLSIRTPSEIALDEHTKRLCCLEKDPKERFKPFFTLRQSKTVHLDSPVLKTMDLGSINTKATQMLNLSDSLNLLAQQERRVKEEQIKSQQERLLFRSEQEEQKRVEDQGSDGEHNVIGEDSDTEHDQSDGNDPSDH